MLQESKKLITEAAQKYMTDNGMSQNEAAKQSGVNAGYLSAMFHGKFTTKVQGKDTPIGDKWFIKLAEWCGCKFTKQYWKNIATPQFLEGINALEVAKTVNKATMIIGSTGAGKTNFIDAFIKKNPQYTYRITISSLYRLNDVINELGDKLSVDFNNGTRATSKVKVDMIIDKLININLNYNVVPLVIFDEGENTKMPLLNMLKALYDKVIPYCSIAIIGTDQLLHKLQKLRRNSIDAVPQFARRFKAGTIMLSEINKYTDFKPFFKLHNIEDGLAQLLTNIADNYGELKDYLEPALVYADKKQQSLTEQLFRIMYNMPKR
jgi:DNA transposition AAA+ family ATPase